MNRIFLLLGSNLGNSENMLHEAEASISAGIGTVVKRSAIYQTAAWGKKDQPDFLNRVLEINSQFNPSSLIRHLLAIEKKMGRTRDQKNDPRTIDIDILLYGHHIIDEPGLEIPHPRMQHRRFVLVPLNEIAPHMMHPVLNKTMRELLSACTDPLDVKKF